MMKLHSVHTFRCELEGARVWTNSRIARAARGLPGLWPCHVILKKITWVFHHISFKMFFYGFSLVFKPFLGGSHPYPRCGTRQGHLCSTEEINAVVQRWPRGSEKTSSGSPTTSGNQRPGRSERRTSQFRWGKNDDF